MDVDVSQTKGRGEFIRLMLEDSGTPFVESSDNLSAFMDPLEPWMHFVEHRRLLICIMIQI